MDKSKAAIGRPSKFDKLVSGLKGYISAARADSKLPLTILAISKAIGVKKSTIYRHQHKPEVAEQLTLLRTLALARKRALTLDDGDSRGPEDSNQLIYNIDLQPGGEDAELIDLEVLTIRASGAVQKAVWSMNRFIGRHRKHQHVSDLPRVVYDLDKSLAELRMIRGEIGTLCDDWRQAAKDETADQRLGAQLNLPNLNEGQS